jgi:hypothetical protein
MLQCSTKCSIDRIHIKKENNMSAPKKSTRTEGHKSEVVENFAPLYTKNVERLAELQKKSLEVASEQNAEFFTACKKAFNFAPETPGLFWFDVIGQTFERAIETQKGAVDLAVEQARSITSAIEERTASAAKVAEGVTALFEQTAQQTIAAKKKAIEYFAEQQKSAYEAAKKQFKFANPAAEAFQTGFDVLIETQKSLLDVTAKTLKSSVAA